MIAARDGGGDPDANLTLRYAIDRAKAGNMPNDSIDRAIKKATGELGDTQFHEILYEGYGPGGVAILAEVLTDNRNRTAPEMRKIFSSSGGNLANPGAVAFMFERKGLIAISGEEAGEEEVFEAAADAGAEDVTANDDQIGVVTSPQDFEAVKQALLKQGWTLTTAELAWVSSTEVTPSPEDGSKVETILAKLDDHDDVQAVHTNYLPAS